MKIKDTNKLAIVDLQQETVEVKDLPLTLIKMYLGGRGINSYLLYRFTDETTDPLSENNALIVGTGLLTGAKGLNFSRTTITAKSPESGMLGDANIGGGFGVMARKNGVGYVVLRNRAKTPKIVVIEKEQVRIEDADALWGKDTQEVQRLIGEKYPGSESLCIGPAGENKVVFACVMNRMKNAAARCGMGAVMGSKNVKAIVAVSSEEKLEPEDQKNFHRLIRDVNKQLQTEFLIDRLKEYGTSHLYEIINESIGMGRVRGGRSLAFLENETVNAQELKKFYVKRAGCQNCVLRCQHVYECNGIKNEGPEYGVLAHFGPVLGIGKIESVLKLNELVNRLGIDASSAANIIAWFIDLKKEGLLPDTFNCDIDWGRADIVYKLIEDIAYRRGVGDFLADGPREMLKELPEESADSLCWTKKLVQSEPVDLRCLPAYALSNSVASRGSDHLRSRPIWVAFEFPDELLQGVYGETVDADALSYKGKGKVVYWWEHYLAMFDMLGLCKFLGFHTLPPGIDFSVFAGFIKTMCGLEFSVDELKEIGERLINIERLYLQREGITRDDDYPPVRTFLPLIEKEGVREEDRDKVLDKNSYDIMLDEYYQKRGWSKKGRVAQETINRLKLIEEIEV